jgi:hypothetical protein
MKRTAGLLMVAVVAISCNSKRNSLEQSNIKGKVKKIQETSYYGEGKVGNYKLGNKSSDVNNLYLFDEKGNITEMQSLNYNGKPEQISKYLYNNNDDCIEINTYKEDKLVGRYESKIEGGKVVEVKIFDENGNVNETYKYSYAGKQVSNIKIINKDGKPINSISYKSSHGVVDSQTRYDSTGKILMTYIYKWNKKNDLIESSFIYPNETEEHKTTYDYEYDKKSNWVKQFELDNTDKGEIDKIVIRNISYFDDVKNSKSGDIVGMWFVIDEKDWIELRKDKKYDSGYEDKINESGSWEIDEKQQFLTFRATDPGDSKKYKYSFEGNQMVLSTIQGEEKMRLEKR